MDYKVEISEAENKVKKFKKDFSKLISVLKKLKVGDTVYEDGCAGMEMEYYPQQILEIDLKKGRLLTYEESIKKTKWVTCFHLINEKNNKFEFHG